METGKKASQAREAEKEGMECESERSSSSRRVKLLKSQKGPKRDCLYTRW